MVFDVYVEYVPHPVPRGPRSVRKRGRAKSSSGLFGAKKSRQSSTRLGTQVIGSVLLGEHIDMFCLFVVCFCLLTEYFSSFTDGAVAAMLESEDDDAPLVLRR